MLAIHTPIPYRPLFYPTRLRFRGFAGLGCADPLAMNANSADTIPCVYGNPTPPPVQQVLGNQPNVTGGGGYEPVDDLSTYLYSKVVTPAAGSPTGQYVDPSLMQTMLQQAAQQYCAGVSYGGPNNPCAGEDISSVVSNLTGTYSAQVAAKGGTPTIGANNAPGYIFTPYAPGYNSGGLNLIKLPDGTTVPNSPQNLALAQQMYNQSLGVPVDYTSSSDGVIDTTAHGAKPVAITSGSGSVSGANAGAGGAAIQTSNSNSNQLTSSNSTSDLISSGENFLSESALLGLPNWVLIGIGLGAVILLPKMLGK
jgi:hypothetical protein